MEATVRKPFLLLVAAAGLVAAFLKRQRERELNEAIWEQPRDI